jgi:flagellar motor switch/type III secretory pathway protein FliN
VSEPTQAVAPLLFLGEQRRSHLVVCLTQRVKQWTDAWLPELGLSASVEIHDPRSQPIDIRVHEAECFRVRVGADVPLVLIALPRALHDLMGVTAAGAATYMRDEGTLATALELEAVRGFAAALLRGSTGLKLERVAQPASEIFRAFDAARYIRAVITVGERRCMLSVLLAPAFAESLLPKGTVTAGSESLERRRSAVGEEIVAVDAVLGTADVPVADLAALAIGDVIVLNQGLTDGAELAVRGGKRISGAALGRVDGKRAIQIRGRIA